MLQQSSNDSIWKAAAIIAIPITLAILFKKPRTHPYSKYLVTAQSQEQAERIAKALLDQRLIACCNIVPNIKSMYVWKDNIESSTEVLMIMKSKTKLLSKIHETVRKNHSYDVFQLIQLPIEEGNDQYLKWIHDNTQ